MGDRKFIGLWVAVFVAVVLVVAGSAAWAEEGKVERTSDTFQLGNTGCEVVIVYKEGQILKAIARVIGGGTSTGPPQCYTPIDFAYLVKPIQNFVVCSPGLDGDLDLTNCKVLAGVEQTVVEENTGSCTYPVNTRTGQRLVIPLPGC